MSFDPLNLSHKNIVDDRLGNLDINFSEYSFPNLYLFREKHNYLLNQEDYFFITGITYDNHTFLMPLFNIEAIDNSLLFKLAKEVDFIFPVEEKFLGHFDSTKFSFSYSDNDSDYIYLTDSLAKLCGNSLSTPRYLRNRLLRNHEIEIRSFNRDTKQDALNILNSWQNEYNGEKIDADYYPCYEGIANFRELNLMGYVFYAGSLAVGFIIGEEKRGNAILVHFAKGIRKYVGIYQFMFSYFAKALKERYKYINLGQDLGIESLRHAKRSYRPHHFLKKYRIKKI